MRTRPTLQRQWYTAVGEVAFGVKYEETDVCEMIYPAKDNTNEMSTKKLDSINSGEREVAYDATITSCRRFIQ